ncbi:MAG: hypothetical protein H3C62_01990 [Gemmatimonadaceae bacterium]|nr:hypothetical protein [Gemmatimonadaceae bacterium]
MNAVRRMFIGGLILTTVACGGNGGVPTGPSKPPGDTGSTPCPYNPAIKANDPACVAPPPPAAVALVLVSTSTMGEVTVRPVDSTTTITVPFLADQPEDRRWFVAPTVNVRLANGDLRVTSAVFTPLDPTRLEARTSPGVSLRALGTGCTKLQIDAEGLSGWVWVNVYSSVPARCP